MSKIFVVEFNEDASVCASGEVPINPDICPYLCAGHILEGSYDASVRLWDLRLAQIVSHQYSSLK